MRQEYKHLKESGGPIGQNKFADLKANATTAEERAVVEEAERRVVK